MKITVIGCGRWGSCIAWYLDKISHDVTLYGRNSSKNMQEFIKDRSNGVITLSPKTSLSTSLSCVENSDVIVISINSQGLLSLMRELQAFNLKNKVFVLCMKGIDIESRKRLSEIVSENTDTTNNVAVWLGPGHVQEFF